MAWPKGKKRGENTKEIAPTMSQEDILEGNFLEEGIDTPEAPKESKIAPHDMFMYHKVLGARLFKAGEEISTEWRDTPYKEG